MDLEEMRELVVWLATTLRDKEKHRYELQQQLKQYHEELEQAEKARVLFMNAAEDRVQHLGGVKELHDRARRHRMQLFAGPNYSGGDVTDQLRGVYASVAEATVAGQDLMKAPGRHVDWWLIFDTWEAKCVGSSNVSEQQRRVIDGRRIDVEAARLKEGSSGDE